MLRFSARQALWLDEAQSVAIASLPLGGHGTTLFDGLRADGSPPLYYLLLHGWIELFGAGTSAVRSLSALLNLAAVAPLYLLGRRIVGRRAAMVAVLLHRRPRSPLYFATETRMYSLVVLLHRIGWARVGAGAAPAHGGVGGGSGAVRGRRRADPLLVASTRC